jgi:hypothetical protein
MEASKVELAFTLNETDQSMIDEGKGLIYIGGKSGGEETARIKFECTVVGAGINESEWGQTVMIKPEADAVAMIEESEITSTEFMKDITYKSILRNNTIFLKLPFKNDKYSFACKPSFKPSGLDKSPFVNNASFTLECNIFLWINLETKTGGISVRPVTVSFKKSKKK